MPLEPTYDHHVVLHPGTPPCVVRFTASTVDVSDPTRVVLMYISRIETLKSAGCEAGVLYTAAPDEPDIGPTGGFLPTPGHERDPDFEGSNLRFVDLDHDGYLDLDFLLYEGKLSTDRPQFHFDPKKRSFH